MVLENSLGFGFGILGPTLIEWQEKDKNKSKDKVIISFAIAMELGMSIRNYCDAYLT